MKKRLFEKGSPLFYFEEISRIPRGSGNLSGIIKYLENFALAHGLFEITDEYGNVIIKKPAAKGYEDRPTVILQGHSDMVCATEAGSGIDMEKTGLDLYIDGDLLKARGTTLGADDGVSITYALSILADEEAEHPALEVLFTSDEETGMTGAKGLDASMLDGRILINLDTDCEGDFIVGCAGGVRVDVSLPVKREAARGVFYSLALEGLIGGHSGAEIHKGRANAISVIAKLLSKLPKVRLISLSGGAADNAIPRDAAARFVTESEISEEEIKALFESFRELTRGEDEAKMLLEAESSHPTALTREASENLLSLISEIPTGVIAMSPHIEGLVESSENIGLVNLSEGSLSIAISVRSSKRGEKETLVSKIRDLAKKRGAIITTRGAYPEWEYRENSYLRDTMRALYLERYGEEPRVYAIHAGLECGILSSKLEGLDCVSTGPTAKDIHTPFERLSISSAERVYEYLRELLKRI